MYIPDDDFFRVPSEQEEDENLFGQPDGMFSGGRGLFDDLDDTSEADGLFSKANSKPKRAGKQDEVTRTANGKEEGIKDVYV